MAKYGNKRVRIDGITFDSKHEANRYCELRLLQRAGRIHGLELQKPYDLLPAQYIEIPTGQTYTRGDRKGQPKTRRVCVEKGVKYVADFAYIENGKPVVEDAKGVRTEAYRIKRKLMLHVHGIRIKEV